MESVKLTMLQGPRMNETLTFNPGNTIKIGRIVRGNSVSIKDEGISSKHISIEFRRSGSESGKWVIQDLGSSNGTLLNGSKITPLVPFDIRNGDEIKIGESTSIGVEIEGMIRDFEDDLGFNDEGKRGIDAEMSVVSNVFHEKIENSEALVENKVPRAKKRNNCGEIGKDNVSCDKVEKAARVNMRITRSMKMVRGFRKNDEKSSLEAQRGLKKDCKVHGEASNLDETRVLEEKLDVNGVDCNANGKDVRIELKDNVCFDEAEKAPRVNMRSTRSVRRNKGLVADSMFSNNEEISSLKTRRGLNKKKKIMLQDEEENLDNTNVHGFDQQDELLENTKGVNLRPDILKESRSGARKSSVDMGNEVTLENMTIGQWLDDLEISLLKDMSDETEKMIANLEENAKRFYEYYVQNMKGDKSMEQFEP